MRIVRSSCFVASVVMLGVAFATPASARARIATAAPQWAPAATATIHPGVQMFTDGAQCTANFIFADGANTYIGYAAHCAGTGGSTETNGCDAGSLPLGTEVDVTGASRPGSLVYSSWLAMQAVDESDADACAYNDFALVRLDPADVSRVNPSVPYFGGPTGIGAPTNAGDMVYSYGNSSLRNGITQLSPKSGISLGNTNGWSNSVYTLTPGIPGDSGSGFLNAQGQAIGVLSTLELAPKPLGNNFGDLARQLQYLNANSALGSVGLVNGTEAFRAPPLFLPLPI